MEGGACLCLDAAPRRADIAAMATRQRTTTATAQKAALKFSAINAILLLAGLASIAIGYVLLAGGSTVAAPLLLVLGYAVLVPLGIIL